MSYKLREWYTSNLLIKSTKNGIFCKISKEWTRKRSSFKNPLASWDFFNTGFWGYIWNYYGSSLRICGRRLVSILLVKLPSGLHVAKSSKSEVLIIYIGIISWKFSWLRMSEILYLIANLHWIDAQEKLPCNPQEMTRCWLNVKPIIAYYLYFIFQNNL